jgi:hypothetical protein
VPHFWLPEGTALFDHFGQGFTLLMLKETDTSAIQQAACSRTVPLTLVRRPEPELRDLYQANLVLVRPDQHAAWRADALPADPGCLLDTVCGYGSRNSTPHD